MKTILLSLMLALPAFAFAGPQQEKMKACNQEAAGMKGDERKAFMKGCLSKKAEAPPITSPQLRMKECNEKAKNMKGEERAGFMKTCLTVPN